MEDYYEYLDSNGVTTLYKLIKDDTVALIDSYSVTINGITTTLDTHINNSDIHTPIADIENMVDTKIAGLVNSAPETLDTLKELSDALGNDTNFATTVANQIGSKASKDDVYTKEETDTLLEGKANSVHNHVVSDITDFPTIPTKTSELINDSGFLTSSSGVITSVSWSDITDKPNFSTVATSGSYNDLSNKPTIPKVYNKTLTIQKNGTNVATFTSNSNTDVTADITVPTKVSELSNDSGFITGISWDKVTNKPTLATVATSGSYTDLSNAPTIPTKVSQLENDMGFGTGGDTSDCVHRTGDEHINGNKIFSNTIYRYADLTTSTIEQVYRFDDTNANGCGHIYNNVHWHNNAVFNRHGAYNAKSGKTMEIDIISNDSGVGMAYVSGSAHKGNLETVTSATGHNAIATMGWVNNPATSTNVVHRSGDETITGNKTFTGKIICTAFTNSVNNSYVAITGSSDWDKGATLALHGEESSNGAGAFVINCRDKTRSLYLVGRPNGTLQWGGQDIATTAWVINYVNSVGRSSISAKYSNATTLTAAGRSSSSDGSSIAAYYSTDAIVTAIGTDTSNTSVYPADFSNYIDISPKVGTIYTGSQLFSTLNASASGSKNTSYSDSGAITYQTTAKATANFSGAFSSSAKYLCTTANAVRFRAFVSQGTNSDIGTASVVDNSSARSIFTRIE